MSSEWREISLRDAVQFIVDNRGKTAPTVENGFALIATNCVNNKDLYPQKLNLRYVSQDTYENWFRAHPKAGDILLTNKGSQNGAICLVPDPVDFCIAQDMVALRADPKKIDPLYLFAALRSEVVQQRIKALNVDAVIPHLKKTDFDKLFIPLPDAVTQKWIGDWYFQLCRRIELLRETNTTLEAIAQALFKSWFVDFDPVHAKLQGRAPEGMDEATAALFPDSFEESELGDVPKGWRVQKFEDFIDRQSVGKKFDQKTAFASGQVPILDQGKSGVIGFHNEDPGIKASLENPVVVFANHTCYVRLICFDFSAIQNVLPFIGKGVDTVWAFYATKDRIKFSEYKGHWPDFSIEKAIVPSVEFTDIFRRNVNPLMARIRNNEQQVQNLSALRDALLPRLISGQLSIAEAEEALS